MKKINWTVLFFAVVFGFFSCATNKNAAHEEGRFYEESGGFSIVIPESWQVTEIPGFKYKALAGQTENDFTSNINFVDEAFDGELNFYVDASIEHLETLFGENFELLQRGDFVTLKKLNGVRLVTSVSLFNVNARQIMYFFPGKGKKMVITCTIPVESGESRDAFFDGIVETFEWTK